MAKLKILPFCQQKKKKKKKKKKMLASKLHMHIFNTSLTCVQCFKEIQRKVQEELISQSIHY